MGIAIRPFRSSDLEELTRITVEAFAGIALDQRVEEQLGILHGHDWRWRKARHIEEDVQCNPAGVFVAEENGRLLGYITTRLERDAGKGRIPNLAVIPEARGSGLGRMLIEHALDYFRGEGMSYAMIETMAYNEVGNHLYPACGFIEVARQVHFARKL
ncbi:MAG: GNAT family N-acetyltransferase [Verrucomicrobia subdivision 3 bacterium]|nr:GNAT family N-acetyltransferase [Limisphaerales bacterium]